MSTALGIASVTHVLKDLLNDGFVNNNVAAAVGTVVGVTSISPGQVEPTTGTTPTQLNLFMYRTTPNVGWNNHNYPSRNGRGDVINNPPLALDLHYLITAFGESELHSEILLGYAMQILHENPVLDRGAINTSLSAATAANPGGRLPANLLSLATSELSEQIEQIKITPDNINLDEISKLWTAFQIRYRPCTAYKVTVVLIESKKSTLSPLPVLTRTFYTFPFQPPVIDKILSQTTPGAPVLPNQQILVGHRLVIRGTQLKRDPAAVLINGEEFTPLDADVEDTQVSIAVPATLKAGVQGVQIAHYISMVNPPPNRISATSNLLAFVLSPSISNIAVTNDTVVGGLVTTADFNLTVDPGVFRGQRILLQLNETNLAVGQAPRSYSFSLPDDFLANEINAVVNLVIPIEDIAVGSYLVRLQVDGAQSPLTTSVSGEFDGPQINIP